MIQLAIAIILAYLIGSIPTGYLVVKLLKNEDIRETGSGSTGATNVKRILGTKWFITVMVLDAIKGAIPVIIGGYIVLKGVDWGLGAAASALFVLIGHSKSIFLNFTGGKSVASAVGTFFALCWPIGLITAIIWAAATFVSRYVSFGSLLAVCFTPVLMTLFKQPPLYVTYSAVAALYVIYLHKENIKRLLTGEENKIR